MKEIEQWKKESDLLKRELEQVKRESHEKVSINWYVLQSTAPKECGSHCVCVNLFH